MALIDSFEKSGNYLFKHRGEIPVVLFLAAVPVVYFTGYGGLKLSQQLWISILSVLISFLGFIIRAVAIGTTPKGTSGRNTEEQVAESLNTGGIYSMVRHPLYLGNYLMWIGIVIFTFNPWFILAVSLAFWLYYERIMFAEERFLERKFGESYLEWTRTVPAFIPSFKNIIKSELPFSFRTILRREYSGVLATAFGFFFVDQLRYLFEYNEFALLRTSFYALLGAALLALVLRSLKHYTGLLKEAGRS
jgi:protein-S-isoprenylcysteine O-methyltransferase Ste14